MEQRKRGISARSVRARLVKAVVKRAASSGGGHLFADDLELQLGEVLATVAEQLDPPARGLPGSGWLWNGLGPGLGLRRRLRLRRLRQREQVLDSTKTRSTAFKTRSMNWVSISILVIC